MKRQKTKISYKDSGVDINKADKLIKTLSTCKVKVDKNIISGIGGFSSLYRIDKKIKDPVIVSGTDGVGTKLKIASKLGIHKYIGQDLVAMCVNDVITTGAKPLFFLDYLATSKVNLNLHKEVLGGIQKACNECQMTLIGGETAEMPGMYSKNDYDLAGFCVGIVSEKKIIHSKLINEDNLVVGLSSSGIHSNGYSLINKLIKTKRIKLSDKVGSSKLSNLLIKPTKLYANIINSLLRKCKINGLAHITGGGLTENIPRIIPNSLAACISLSSLKIPNIFTYLQDKAGINDNEILKTFNCGIGMVMIIDKSELTKVHKLLTLEKYPYKIIGHIISTPNNKKIVYVD